MRAGLTDCHTNRGALHPSGFHPHEKQSAAERGKGWGLQITHTILFLPIPCTVAVTASVITKHCRKKRLYPSSGCQHPLLVKITGCAAAVIKVPFQHSTHHDFLQCKHSLSQLNPKSLHWDVNGYFYVGEKEKRMHIMACTGKMCYSLIWEMKLDGF